MTSRVRSRLRRGALAGLLASVLLLAGCAGLPTSGPVNPGGELGEEAVVPDFSFRPAPPPEDASPQQIVEGFIAAGSGPQGGWETAREYLAPELRDTWKPEAGVTIDVGGPRAFSTTGEEALTLTLTPVATVNDVGAYEVADEGSIALKFRLAQQEDDQWRITEAPDGIVLDQDRFAAVFRSYALMYFDPTRTFLVPDLRWYATNPATRIASALLDGAPSPWLAGAVATSFPENVGLETQSVPVQNGVADVDLQATALTLDRGTLDLMQTQLEASLATAGATTVQMSVASQPIDAVPVPTRSTQVQSRPVVLSGDEFGLLAGSSIEQLPGLSEAIAGLAPASVQIGADRRSAAVRLIDGDVARVLDDGSVTTTDTRARLIDPTIDPFGYVWSVPSDAPASVRAVAPDGSAIDIATAWPGAGAITAMQVSRDGTRMAALVRSGDRPSLWIAGVVRDREGVPTALGEEPLVLSALPGAGVDVGWLDAVTVGAIAQVGDDSVLVQQVVGGAGQSVTAPTGITSIAGANQVTTIRLLAADGVLYVRRGTNWQQLATDIRLLATQQGSPG